jgi:hypothetical protein
MTCRDAELQIFAEGEVAMDENLRPLLASHISNCVECRHKRDNLSRAIGTWRSRTRAVVAPDADRAWNDLRRELRRDRTTAARPSRLAAWIATPLAAAAALALMMLSEPGSRVSSGSSPSHQVARADYVEVPSRTASTVVYVDDESGWLVVWASDGAGTRL